MGRNELFDPKVVEAEEDLLIDYQFLLREVMSKSKISNTELAARAGMSKARLSQILSADANPTLKTFARLFNALDLKLTVAAYPITATGFSDEESNHFSLAMPEINEWDFEKTRSVPASDADHQMVAVVRDTVAAEASNDNYAPRRVEFLDSDFPLIEPELELDAA